MEKEGHCGCRRDNDVSLVKKGQTSSKIERLSRAAYSLVYISVASWLT